jgi:ubiquinol-cytochrome c reductase cytochrome c1 subunit
VATGVVVGGAVLAEGFAIHPPHYHWNHKGVFDQLDMKSVRRGYEVYKQVCAACHSMNYMYYRRLVNKTHTEDEAKAEAAQVDVLDEEPDEVGNPVTRKGKLADRFPNPYPNEQAARAANNGALPPDLTLMVNARHGNEDYVFSILTGYQEEPPAGIPANEDQHFNAYFAGDWIGMAPPLYNEILEYSDGTPATLSQLAKDVTTFLRWTAEPEFDDRKRMYLKVLTVNVFLLLITFAYKRRKWSLLKSRKTFYKDPQSGKTYK